MVTIKWPDEVLCNATPFGAQDAFLKSCSVFECVAENVAVTSNPALSHPMLPPHLRQQRQLNSLVMEPG